MVPVELLQQALAQIAALTAELAATRAERAALQAQLEAVTTKLDALLAKTGKKPPPAEPAAPLPPPPALDARPRPPEASADDEPTPRAPRTRKPRPELPVVEETVRPEVCAHCGGSRLSNKDTDEVDLVDYVPGYLRRRRVRRIRCRCADCARVTSPGIPGASLPKTHFTAAFVAWVLYNKFALHLPLERQRRDLARMGHPMSSSQLSDLVQRSLAELQGVADVLFRQLMAGSHCHADATGLPVVTPDKDKTHLGQIFVFCWGDLAAFRYAPDKKGETFASMVEPFKGTLVLDASSTHDEALSTGRITWAGCNAHGLRKFRDAKDSDPVLAAEGERWIASWFDQERIARDRGLVGADLLAWRHQHIRSLVDGFRRWLEAVHPTVLPKAPLAEATRYYANHWRALTTFLRDPGVPLENNFAERCLRGQALGRNNWLFAGSHQAGHHTAVAYTLVQTARLHGLDVLAYLTWVLERTASCRDGGALYAALTPAAYQEAQKSCADG